MNSRSGSLGAPCSRMNALKSSHSGRWVRSYSARKAAHSRGSSAGSPENVGATPDPLSSNGLQLTIRTYGVGPLIESGEADDVVLHDDVGPRCAR